MPRACYAAVLLVAAALSCTRGGDAQPDSALDPDVAPVTNGTWYRPSLDVRWQLQLQGELNTSYEVDLFDLDLFDVSAPAIAELHSRDRKVICYFSAGSSEDWRPDFSHFDAASLGAALSGWEGERWLDIRRADVAEVVRERLDLAKTKGCDGVDPDNVNAFLNDSGFPLTGDDQLAFNRFIANQAHARGLAVGLKNDGEQAVDLVDYFDFNLNEQCHQYDECETLLTFVDDGKPVLNVEYRDSEAEASRAAEGLCVSAAQSGIRTLILPLALDDAFRVACGEP